MSRAVPSLLASLITKSGWYAFVSEKELVLNVGIKLALSGDDVKIVLKVFLLNEPLTISNRLSSLYNGVPMNKWKLPEYCAWPLCEKYVIDVLSLFSKFTEMLCLAKLELIIGCWKSDGLYFTLSFCP